jgi:hypothetical protein
VSKLVLEVTSEKFSAARETSVVRAVFHTLAYADVFDYPLTAGEVYRYLTSTDASVEEVNHVLRENPLFSRVGDYFTLSGREQIVETRERRARIAPRLWTQAARYGRIIAALPFVRMVAVTGSLAMNNAEEGKDIDFMLVTAPGRLWTVRALSLLVARFAKLAGVRLCPNYLVTTDALEMRERSLYVAHELAQMIPISGLDIYQELRRINDWTDEFLPNASGLPELPGGLDPRENPSPIQKVLALIFRFLPVSPFEKWEMNRKIVRLGREQSASFESYFSADVCKGHMDRHGENIATALAVRLQRATIVVASDMP